MKTVLNKRNIDQLRNPMFLGEDLSLQRYDLIKYPKFYDLYDQQLNFFWRPQEVSLVKDISDYKNLSPVVSIRILIGKCMTIPLGS